MKWHLTSINSASVGETYKIKAGPPTEMAAPPMIIFVHSLARGPINGITPPLLPLLLLKMYPAIAGARAIRTPCGNTVSIVSWPNTQVL